MLNFADLSLSPEVLRAIQDLGYETPSPIQAETLPALLSEPTDFLGLAGTGTGKTAAFAIPLLEQIDHKKREVQAVILCPTRELAIQVAGQIDLLGKYKKVRTVTVYGGSSYADQIRGLRGGATIVVGTPGRVIDHMERGSLNLEHVKVLVLDEADEMFSMGFKEEIDKVLEQMNTDESNIWLFSATMSREVRRVVDKSLRSPKTVQVNKQEVLSSGVEQYFYRAVEHEKPEMICKLIEAADDFYGLIFCQTKSLVSDLTSFLIDRGYKVDCLHGDKDQTARERTMQAFRDRKVRILVCTDVASRGLDVKDITHVINYSLPRELDSYVHRIGRTARSGKTGIAMNLVTLSHKHLIFQIERMTKVQMKEGVLPSRREIATKKVAKLLTGFQNQPFHERVLEVLGEEWKAQLATMTAEQVAAHFIAMLMSDVFNEKDKKLSDSRAPRVAEERAQRAPREFAPVPRSTVRIAAPRPSRSIQTPVIVAEKPRPVRAPVAVPAERPTRVPVAPVVSERPLRSQASAKPTPSVKKIDLDAPPTFGVRTTVGARKAKPFAKPVVRGAPAKPKANQPGPTKTARVEEIPLLNRRARRAEKFAKSAEQESRSK